MTGETDQKTTDFSKINSRSFSMGSSRLLTKISTRTFVTPHTRIDRRKLFIFLQFDPIPKIFLYCSYESMY